MTNLQLALHFFFEIAVILIACQLVGVVGRRVGQPQVVAEMIAGILLGPSLLGLLWPGMAARLFPPEMMRILYPVSQVGLATYMFVIGLEFRSDIVRGRLRSAMAVSIAGMVAPFMLGAALGWYFHGHTSLFPATTTRLDAMLFLGASLCITAFPVLARIIQAKGLTDTAMGAISMGAGAINDAAAWCLLAIVLARLDGNFGSAALNFGGGIGFVALTWLVIRPRVAARGKLSDNEFIFCLILLMLSAWFTDAIGLHAVFGAFVLGAALPRGVVADALIQRIQPLSVALLVPLFFTYSGLNTQIGLLDSGYLWLMATLVLLAAIGGKGVACWLAARATGVSNREAMGIGTLMNVRGLMELIIINIGLQRGIISPALFAALAIMAVVTSVMASPLFDFVAGKRK
jgi:Kef-type K+ transport system membrane component KefB